MKSFSSLIAITISLSTVSFNSALQAFDSVIEGPYKIAFVRHDTGFVNILSQNIDGVQAIKETGVKGGYLAWSPDGKKIAFYAKYDDRKTWSIHTMNEDGSDVRRLTNAKHQWDFGPEWSPDGKKIAFARTYRDRVRDVQTEIFTINPDGSEQTKIEGLSGGAPFYSSAGGKIAYHSQYKDKKSEISVANVDGSGATVLTNNDANDWHPNISPDGTQIAFSSDRDGNFEIYVMDINGDNLTRLTHDAVRDTSPSWSPDGSKIVFSKINEDDRNVYIMNKDGSSVQKLISNSRYAVFQH